MQAYRCGFATTVVVALIYPTDSPVDIHCFPHGPRTCLDREIERANSPRDAEENRSNHGYFPEYTEGYHGPFGASSDGIAYTYNNHTSDGFIATKSSGSCAYSPSSSSALSDDKDEPGIFGTENGSDRGSYRNDTGEDEAEGGTLSLSADSAEWTPLRGSEFLGTPQEEPREGWTAASVDGQVKCGLQGSGTGC